MSRIQNLSQLANKTVLAATPEPVYGSQLYVKSFVVQALTTNTDFVYLGDSSSQLTALAPGKALTIQGDNLDNGTGAKIDLNQVYIKSLVNGEGVAIMCLEGI